MDGHADFCEKINMDCHADFFSKKINMEGHADFSKKKFSWMAMLIFCEND